ncbi:uncharacterized protein LOC132725292 isoform X2 [Ruditapes philippinarum]|uniref:uncharacterized protein LOC132725292 isoform X2 n=1 Tax=Ruditapes philippinarum TaxID=129788 RepID=UPI00295C3725|nr:uncharacterized protein LOC132725292 isoform X2 [Ruditapes philippinarum]
MSDGIRLDYTSVGLNDEQKPDTSTHVHSKIMEIMEETQTKQTKMSEECDRERTSVGHYVEHKSDTSTRIHFETVAETEKTMTSKELDKESDLVVPIEEQKPDNDKLAKFDENRETEVAKRIVSEELDKISDLVVPIEDEEQNPDNDKLANFDENGETEVAKKIVSEELDKISTTLMGRQDGQKSYTGTKVHSGVAVKYETEQTIMSEELDKDREQDLIFERPMCLISSDNGRLEVVDDTVRALEKIEMPLNVVAIAGLYRTGKSYLMNRLTGRNSGFLMGSSIESCTKGIWAWCRRHPKKQNEVLLLLDTEGLGDATKGDIDHDNKIFTLTTLISSTLVYNVMSAFNQDAVEKLTYPFSAVLISFSSRIARRY